MTDERERVERLVREGKVGPAEGNRRSEAMDGMPQAARPE